MENGKTGGCGHGWEGRPRSRPEFAGDPAVARDAVPVGEAVKSVLERIEAHLAVHHSISTGLREAENHFAKADNFDLAIKLCFKLAGGSQATTGHPHWEAHGFLGKSALCVCQASETHHRPLALSLRIAENQQATWKAIIAMPSAVVYGRIASMGQAAFDEWFDSFHLSQAAGVTAPFVARSICTCELRDGSLLPRTQ